MTSTVDSTLIDRALGALLKHHEASAEGSNQLLGNDLTVQVQIGLDKVPVNPSPKPIRLSIPHSLHSSSEQEPSVCLIVKEESKPWCQEMIAKFPDHMGCIKKVLGLQSLRKKYGRFDQKRDLLNKFDMFMADDRILPMLAKCLGKNFFETKKQPVPVRLTRKEALPFAIQNSLQATYLFLSAGTCLTIRAGNTSMDLSDLIDNVNAIVKGVVEKIPRKWANVRNISIKTTGSMSLPFYNKTPEELQEIAEMAGVSKTAKANENQKKKEDLKKEEEDEKKKRKLQAAKSPLVRALKKQKGEEATAKEPKSEKKAKKEKKAADAPMTPKVKKTPVTPKVKKTPKQESESVPKESKSTSKKAKKVKEAKKEEPAEEAGEKKAFIKSKKFVKSKPGYVFRMGDSGLGYYVDVKPVPDRMALAALARLADTPGRGGGRRKSGGGSARRRR